jgi:hypothetical protein
LSILRSFSTVFGGSGSGLKCITSLRVSRSSLRRYNQGSAV